MSQLRFCLVCLIAGSFTLFPTGPAKALIILRATQVGPDLVLDGSGSADTAALNSLGSELWTNVLSPVQAYAGPAAFQGVQDVSVSLWSGLSGPSAFGSDPLAFLYPDDAPAVSFGDLFGIRSSITADEIRLVLPSGYVSGSALSGRSTFSNITFAEIGISPGQTYTWSWGNGSSADTLQFQFVPLADQQNVPSPLPLAGAVGAFHSARRLRRRMHTSGISISSSVITPHR
jgi:hypothetical protein